MIPGSANPLLLASAAGEVGPYAIERSVRFNSADSAYLNRTPASAGNRRTWTWSGWVKRGSLGTDQHIFVADSPDPLTDSNFGRFYINSTNQLYFSGISTVWRRTSALLRDPSAWYHFVLAVDTTQSTADDRVKIYINGTQVTSFDITNNPSQNADLGYNEAAVHTIGVRSRSGTLAFYYDGYLADIHFIDGQALDPTSFGEFDTNGVWQPKAYSGSYGTNGFHLPFSDNSTAAALGTDASGNGNDWTPNNFAVTPVNSYQITGFDSTNGGGAFANSTLPASGDGTNAYHFPRANATYTLSKTLTATTKIEAYCYIDGSSGPTIQANGGSVITIPAGFSYAWSKVNLGVTSLSSITLSAASWSARDFWLSCFIVDDVVVYGTPALAAGNDSLVDTPTNYGEDTGAGGEVRGNYATWNPLSTTQTLSNGNLDVVTSTNGNVFTTVGISSGKYYCEYTINSASLSYGPRWGFSNANLSVYAALRAAATRYAGAGVTSITLNNHTSSITSGVIGINLDLDSYECKIYHNNNLKLTATGIPPGVYHFWVQGDASTDSVSLNAGQRPFAYTAPSGFKALCTANLPTPTIEDGSTAMDVVTYTGNGSTQTISGLEFSPDLVWIKNRAAADNNKLLDTVRGATEELESNTTDAEATNADGLTAFNSDGFDLGADAEYNTNTETYVAWTWDAGSSTVTNTDGSITSTVRANTSAGFSVVTYTGNGTAGATVGHGLNVAPSFYVCKFRNTNAANGPWYVYHKSLGATKTLTLNATDAESTLSSAWNNTEPSSTVFSLGNAGDTNGSGRNFVSYCFAPVDGYSSFGSYVGNGSSDGPMVYTGFRPRWLMIKRTDGANSWQIMDAARSDYNVADDQLYADLSNSEGLNSLRGIDFLSNGFKVRGTNSGINASNGTYVYVSFAENPFALNARAR